MMATNGHSPEAGTAVITGGASGIGRSTVRLFAERGWNVLFTDIAPEGEAVETEVKDAGGQAIFVQGDVSDPQHAARLVA
jgi:NAD(P)-dependent dehydrogenase (short-subunit alcohol dehydrogenase family)